MVPLLREIGLTRCGRDQCVRGGVVDGGDCVVCPGSGSGVPEGTGSGPGCWCAGVAGVGSAGTADGLPDADGVARPWSLAMASRSAAPPLCPWATPNVVTVASTTATEPATSS